MKIRTVWERYNKKDSGEYAWEHNHISNGYSEKIKEPIPRYELQKRSWKGGKWRSFKAYLINNKIEIA